MLHSQVTETVMPCGLFSRVNCFRPATSSCRPRDHSRTSQSRTCILASASSSEEQYSDSVLQSGPKRRRVLLKVSGEALQGGFISGTDPKVLESVSKEVAAASQQGVEVAIVVGGGNYFRGAAAWSSWGLERATADNVGMLATCMNAIMLQSAIEKFGVDVRVQTAIEMREIAEPFIRRKAIRHLERGRVVIFGAGTGNPFMTTDTAAALRAAEINSSVLLKATKVDGVFDCDPVHNSDAKLHRSLSYRQLQTDNLKVMDETAITLCKENDIKVVVFNISTPGNILRALLGDTDIGTTVSAQIEEDNRIPAVNQPVVSGSGTS